MRIEENRVKLDATPKSTLKITGTRFGTVLGLNAWATPFSAWAEITKVFKRPFESNKYLEAGKVIEPKLIQAVRDLLEGDGMTVEDPEGHFGLLYDTMFKKKDFFDDKVFGGMWDAMVYDNGKPYAVIECKTTGRPQDWVNGIPAEKLLQGLLYAELEHTPKMIMPVAFLEEEDYAHPENFEVVWGKNAKLFTVDTNMYLQFGEANYTITDFMAKARSWFRDYVETGISPELDNKADKEILDELMKTVVSSDINDMEAEWNEVKSKIEKIYEETGLADLESRLKTLEDAIKKSMIESMPSDLKSYSYGNFTLSRSDRKSVDSAKLKADGLYEKYCTTTTSYTLRKSASKEN